MHVFIEYLAEMQPLIILFAYLIIHAYASHSAQQERCEKLQSVADTAAASCSVGHSCFSLDCTLAQLVNLEFHIFIEPCKHPAAILVKATVAGHEFSHEFSHSETVAIPSIPSFPTLDPKLAVFIDNSDSQNLVFSVKLLTLSHNYTIVPETSFPLNNITCANGHLVTSASTAAPAPSPGPYSCQGTCVAIHKMTAKSNSLCRSTGNCLTINCDSPQNLPHLAVFSSYRIEPCTSPPTIRATFDNDNNNKHFSKNITHNSTFSLPINAIGNPRIQVTLVDVNDYTILFGVNLLIVGKTIPILPEQTIPIDKSGCPGYTGPSTNPYCTTQSTEPVVTTPVSDSSGQHSPPTATGMSSPVSPSLNHTAAAVSDVGKLAGIILGVILANVVIVLVAVLVTAGVVWYAFKRKTRGVYTYSQFQAMEEDD